MNLSAYIPYCLALIMFSMGLSLQLADFKRLLIYPKAIALGLGCQIVLLPLLAWGLAAACGLSPILTAGLVLLALCPGGVSSNLASHLAGGNAALSVSLTAASSIITVFTLPLVMTQLLASQTGAPHEFSLPLLSAIERLAQLTLLPLLTGMIFRHGLGTLAKRLEGAVAILAAVLFCFIIITVWWQQWDNIRFSAQQTGVAAILLNLLALLLGWAVAKWMRLGAKDQTTLCLEVGLQNSALAVVVAINLIGNAELAIPASIYSVVMVCSAVSVIIASRWRFKRINCANAFD